MKEDKRMKIFLTLTKIHRDIVNNKGLCRVSWYKEFEQQGFNNPVEVVAIKRAMQKMNIITINKDNQVSWNREKTLPNPLLVDGIYKIIKENNLKAPSQKRELKQKQKTINISINVENNNLLITINGILLPSNTTNITR